MAVQPIGLRGIGLRFLFAFLLVCFTWNPTPLNYIDWAIAQWDSLAPLVAFSGLVLLMGWIFFLRTTASSLGVLGIVLCTGLAAIVLWILFRYVISTESTTLISWIVLILFSGILAAGMSWAHLRARWSGQATVDEVDEH